MQNLVSHNDASKKDPSTQFLVHLENQPKQKDKTKKRTKKKFFLNTIFEVANQI